MRGSGVMDEVWISSTLCKLVKHLAGDCRRQQLCCSCHSLPRASCAASRARTPRPLSRRAGVTWRRRPRITFGMIAATMCWPWASVSHCLSSEQSWTQYCSRCAAVPDAPPSLTPHAHMDPRLWWRVRVVRTPWSAHYSLVGTARCRGRWGLQPFTACTYHWNIWGEYGTYGQ